MLPRLNFYMSSPDAMKAMSGLEQQIARSSLENTLVELARPQASQINCCAYCMDVHTKTLARRGERALFGTAGRLA